MKTTFWIDKRSFVIRRWKAEAKNLTGALPAPADDMMRLYEKYGGALGRQLRRRTEGAAQAGRNHVVIRDERFEDIEVNPSLSDDTFALP